MKLKTRNAGFSLLELMITVVIIGILAAIAIPSYTQYVNRARRDAVAGDLLLLVNSLQRFHTNNLTYATATLGSAGVFPSQGPLEGTAYYTFDIGTPAATATTFVARAVPIPGGPMANTGQPEILAVDQTGARFTDVGDDGAKHGADGDDCADAGESAAEEEDASEDLGEWRDDGGDARHGEPGGFNQGLHGHRAGEVHDAEHEQRGTSDDADDGDVSLIGCFGQCVVHTAINDDLRGSIPVF